MSQNNLIHLHDISWEFAGYLQELFEDAKVDPCGQHLGPSKSGDKNMVGLYAEPGSPSLESYYEANQSSECVVREAALS